MKIFSHLFGQLESLGKDYASTLLSLLSPHTLSLFSALVVIWFLWFFKRGALRGSFDDAFSVFKKAILLMVITFCLKSPSFFWEWLYTPLVNTTQHISKSILLATGMDGSADTLTSIIALVEKEIGRVWEIVKAMWREAGIFGFGHHLAALIVLLCFGFMMCLFVGYMLEMVFSLLAMTALAPLLMIAAFFESTRSFTLSALRIVLHGSLTVIFASVAMGFTLSSIQKITGAIPLKDGTFTVKAETFLSSDGFLSLLIIGFIGILFHLKAASLASALTNVSLGNGMATAAVSGAGLYAYHKVKEASGKAFSYGKDHVSSGYEKLKQMYQGDPI